MPRNASSSVLSPLANNKQQWFSSALPQYLLNCLQQISWENFQQKISDCLFKNALCKLSTICAVGEYWYLQPSLKCTALLTDTILNSLLNEDDSILNPLLRSLLCCKLGHHCLLPRMHKNFHSCLRERT